MTEPYYDLLKVFLKLIDAEAGSEEEEQLIVEANDWIDRCQEDQPGTSLASLAYRLSLSGIPYEAAFQDLVTVRNRRLPVDDIDIEEVSDDG